MILQKILLDERTPNLYHQHGSRVADRTPCGLVHGELKRTEDPGDRSPCYVCFPPDGAGVEGGLGILLPDTPNPFE